MCKTRTCSKCNKTKPETLEFFRPTRNSFTKECRSCYNKHRQKTRKSRSKYKHVKTSCLNCGIEFTPNYGARYCSRYCNLKHWYKNNANRISAETKEKSKLLEDSIVIKRIKREGKHHGITLEKEDITPELINLKRKQLWQKRKLKELST